jgi:HK97 family phage prohead protease
VTTATAVPVDNLVRAMFGPAAAELRTQTDEAGDGGVLFGHFAVFNQWTEINSMWEGNFLERIVPGALAATIAERRDQIKILYDHGQDPQLGNKPLGAIRILTEDQTGGYYEVDLLRDAAGGLVSYNRDFIAPAAKAKLLGASFRFRVAEEEWDRSGRSSKYNPDGLDERSITRLDLYEFGPVTFPAYDSATAQMRCGTDRFNDHLLNDPVFVARFIERVGPSVVDQIRASLPPTVEDGTQPPATADGGEEDSTQRRAAYFASATAGFDAHLSRLKEATQ